MLSMFEQLTIKLEGFEDLELAKHNQEVQQVVKGLAEQTARDIESGRIPVGVVVAGAAYHDNASNGRRTDAYRTLEFLIGRPLSNPAA